MRQGYLNPGFKLGTIFSLPVVFKQTGAALIVALQTLESSLDSR